MVLLLGSHGWRLFPGGCTPPSIPGIDSKGSRCRYHWKPRDMSRGLDFGRNFITLAFGCGALKIHCLPKTMLGPHFKVENLFNFNFEELKGHYANFTHAQSHYLSPIHTSLVNLNGSPHFIKSSHVASQIFIQLLICFI